jgi:chemotaxis protein methyltransferase CheR
VNETKLKISEYKNIIQGIYQAGSIDFSEYSLSSLKRRLEQKMNGDRISDSDEFIRLLKTDSKYFEQFLYEISVPVTDFFRDTETWKSIRNNVFSKLAKKENPRILIPECSSGEDLYSLMILLKESNLSDSTEVEACDFSKKNIEKIQKGIYPAKSMEPAGRNYNEIGMITPFSEYFYEKNSDLAVNTRLIEKVKFRIQDLYGGFFQGYYDFVLYRNRLIYYNPQMQDKLLRKIYEMLHKSAFLSLGIGENISLRSDLKFTVIDKNEKIFKKARF